MTSPEPIFQRPHAFSTPLTTEELRTIVKSEYACKRRLGALARELQVSTSYLSLWLSGKSSWNTSELEAKLRIKFRTERLTFADDRRLTSILAVLAESDHPELLSTLVYEHYK